MSDFAVRRGLTVAVGEDRLRERCDAILVQDSGMAYALAERWPSTPQVFRACTEIYDFQFPPQLPDVVQAVVVVNDRVQRRIEALDGSYEIIRLRQPINTDRFRPLVEIHEQPRRAVLLGNYLAGNRARLLTDAWEAAGIECVVVGADGDRSTEPEEAIAAADIVVGKARAALDGMACGGPSTCTTSPEATDGSRPSSTRDGGGQLRWAGDRLDAERRAAGLRPRRLPARDGRREP